MRVARAALLTYQEGGVLADFDVPILGMSEIYTFRL
jgi:hypothetical protein